MKRFSLKKKGLALGLAAGLTLGVAGAAFAFWTANGSGSGTATTGTAAAVDVSATQTNVSDTLYPAQTTAIPLTVVVTNNTSQSESVEGKTLSVTKATCGVDTTDNKAWFQLNSGALPVGSIAPTLSANGTGYTLQMLESGTNQDICSGATVHLTLAIS